MSRGCGKYYRSLTNQMRAWIIPKFENPLPPKVSTRSNFMQIIARTKTKFAPHSQIKPLTALSLSKFISLWKNSSSIMQSEILSYIEPLVTITALFFTIINWIILQRLNAFNQKLSSLKNLSMRIYQILKRKLTRFTIYS